MLANGVYGGGDLHDELLQFKHCLNVALLGSIVHAYIELREHVGTSVDASVTTQQHALACNLLRTHEHGKILALLNLVHHALEINGIGTGILETYHLFHLCQTLYRVWCKAHLHVTWHIVKENGQGQLGHQLLVELSQLGLPCSEIVGWGTDHAIGTVVGSLLSEPDALLDTGIRDARQKGQASTIDAARLLDHLLTHIVRKTLLFACSA